MCILNFLILFILTLFAGINGHGRLMDPVNRASAWRNDFPTPINYDDAANYCGGFMVQYLNNKGKCGVCGDNYGDERPRANENGGHYGTGLIVKTYKSGAEIDINVELTVSHLGYFTYSLCHLRNSSQLETEECFDEYNLELSTGGYKHPVPKFEVGFYPTKLRLPEGLTCEHCVLRWQYTAGNSWGICPDGRGALGCGNQETFRTCSDIRIV